MLAWLNLLGDIRQFPFIGIYVIMFFDIFKTFLKFVAVFIVFIVAFGLGFHTLLLTKVNVIFPVYFVTKLTCLFFTFVIVGAVRDHILLPSEDNCDDDRRI